ncbi:MAG: UTRA domain-containing protein [Paracoccaceae bacterium]
MAKYKQIQTELLSRITSGDWPPGQPIPHEARLAEEFGCTRPTVGRALRGLVDMGLVERRRRAGSRVARRANRDLVMNIPLVREEIAARGGSYSYLRLERERATPPQDVRAHLGGAPALRVLALHFENGQPYQLEDRWISLAAVPQADGESFENISPSEWLLDAIPFSRAEHVLRAAEASGDVARHLGLRAGAAVFVIERSTWLDERGITRVRMSHPADRFSIVTRDPGVWQV